MKAEHPSNMHNAWELIFNNKLVLANRFLEALSVNEVEKQGIRKSTNKSPEALRCSYCGTPVHYVERHVPEYKLFIRHSPANNDETKLERHKGCPYCSLDKAKEIEQVFYGEGKWHFETKYKIESVLKSDPFCKPFSVEVEKYFFGKTPNTRRKPDIQFTDVKGQKWAIELTNHWMTPQIAIEREKFFLKNDFNLIWLLSPKCAEIQNVTCLCTWLRRTLQAYELLPSLTNG